MVLPLQSDDIEGCKRVRDECAQGTRGNRQDNRNSSPKIKWGHRQHCSAPDPRPTPPLISRGGQIEHSSPFSIDRSPTRSQFLTSDMAQSKKEIVAQALVDQGEYALSAFVTSLDNGHSSFSTVVPPAGLKEYWETIRSLGGSHAWPSPVKPGGLP